MFPSTFGCKLLKVKSLNAAGRLDFVKSQRLCFNCLSKGHIPSTCKRRSCCPNCKRRHSSLLHEALAQPQLDAPNNLIGKTAPECSSVMTPKLNPNAPTFSTAHSGCLNSQLLGVQKSSELFFVKFNLYLKTNEKILISEIFSFLNKLLFSLRRVYIQQCLQFVRFNLFRASSTRFIFKKSPWRNF